MASLLKQNVLANQNKELAEFSDPCGYTGTKVDALVEENVEVDPSNIIQRVTNYRLMLANHHVLDKEFSNPFIISRIQLQAFLDNNPDADGIRLYLSKEDNNSNTSNYGVILVPAKYSETDKYYHDLLPDTLQVGDAASTDKDVYVLIPFCRNPPGCRTLGAIFS